MSKQISSRPGRKSTVLFVLVLFFLLNGVLFFRAAVNTLFFMEDPDRDYTEITATVTRLISQPPAARDKKAQVVTPEFSFDFKGETMRREAPALSYTLKNTKETPYQPGDVLKLWIHNYRGEIIQVPTFNRKNIGVSQLVVSGFSLVLALVVWKIRNVCSGHTPLKNEKTYS